MLSVPCVRHPGATLPLGGDPRARRPARPLLQLPPSLLLHSLRAAFPRSLPTVEVWGVHFGEWVSGSVFALSGEVEFRVRDALSVSGFHASTSCSHVVLPGTIRPFPSLES